MKPLSNMSRIVAVLIVIVLASALAGCVPERPAKDGLGPLAVTIDREFTAPATHSPLSWWQAHHPDIVNAGDIPETDCVYCHKVERSCNNCHSYVGVRQIAAAQ